MNGRLDGVSGTGAAGEREPAWNCERERSQRQAGVIALLNQTIEEVAASERSPDLGYRLKGGTIFGRSARGPRQVRGWVYRSELVRTATGRSITKYRAVMETGIFVSTTSGSGLITDSDYSRGRIVGDKSFGYVGFADGYVHFNTSSDAISLLKAMRTTFDLPAVRAYRWRT